MDATGSAPATIDTKSRYLTLDALRGFAVMGILAMNITAFDMPFMAYMSPGVYGGHSGANLISWFVSYTIFDGKMRGLFSLLFGASMLLIAERAAAKGESAAKVHYSRMIWLALFGLAHFFFIWFGDILFLYASVGCVAFLFRKWQPKTLMRSGIGIYAVGALLFSGAMGGMVYSQYRAQQPDATAKEIKDYKEMMSSPEFSGKGVEEDIKIYRSSYAEIVDYKLTKKWKEPFSGVPQSILETLPLMMIGMALLKNGFLLGQWDRRRYRRWAAYGIGIGAIASAVSIWFQYHVGFNLIYVLNAQFAWMALPRLAMTLGYAAALVLVIQSFANSGFIQRVAAAGRAAFTNYLGTSIAMTTIFYGYGLGLYGHVPRAQLWLFVIGAWIVMLLWSKPWLIRFRYGPFEWVWRSLARMKLQPMRK